MKLSREGRASIARRAAEMLSAEVAAAVKAVADAKAAAEAVEAEAAQVELRLAEAAVAAFAAEAEKRGWTFKTVDKAPRISLGYSDLHGLVTEADGDDAPAVEAARKRAEAVDKAVRAAAEDAVAEVELAGRRSDVDRIVSEVVKAARAKISGAKEAR